MFGGSCGNLHGLGCYNGGVRNLMAITSKNTMVIGYAAMIAALCFLIPNLHSAVQGGEVNTAACAAGLIAILLFLKSHRKSA